MFLYHYFEKERGPFRTISDLSDEEAKNIQNTLKVGDNIYAKRDFDGNYLSQRRIIENWLYLTFIEKGGKPTRKTPHYMVIGESLQCNSWFECGDHIKIPFNEFEQSSVSFTYGDSFPTFIAPTFGDKSEYRLNVYTNNEIWEVIKKYGWPQWTVDTPFYQPSYIEVQIWDDSVINKYKLFYHKNNSFQNIRKDAK